MERIDLVIQELTDTMGALEKERQTEIDKIKRRFDHKIESVSETLAIMQQRAGVKPQPVSTLPMPADYPHRGSNLDKSIWAMKKLGGGPMRQLRVFKHLRQYEPAIKRGAIGTAMGRGSERGQLIKHVAEKKRPLFELPPEKETATPIDNGERISGAEEPAATPLF